MKLIDNVRSVKARLTIHGFQDSEEVPTYAGTATRWSQRVILSIAVQHNWTVWISDVATAFLQSDSFEQLAKDSGSAVREVSFTPPAGSEAIFRTLPGHADYNPVLECFKLLRPAYGLKDAPKAWKKKLNDALLSLGAVICPTDSSLYAFYEAGYLTGLVATHVDDIKAATTDKLRKVILDGLTASFGALKTSLKEFEHCGLKHLQTPAGIKVSQEHYAAQLRPINTALMNIKEINTLLNPLQIRAFQSLLGGLSWLVQTRSDICIYVGALQRVATRATTGHVLKLNQLVRWVRKQDCFLFFKPLKPPLKVVVISDAAFRKEGNLPRVVHEKGNCGPV